MLLSQPIALSARVRPLDSGWELALRYLAATAATLLAIAGAQLISPNSFIAILTAITLIGVPISLWLRLSNMTVGRVVISRPLLNGITVFASFGAAVYFVILPMGNLFSPLLSGELSSEFWIHFGGGEPAQALVELFLLFAAFRSFALISDKDATLTTVPSFSVLLLLIPIHKGIEVVVYFVAWTFVAATLLALDHRSEVRAGVSATVPAIIAGQDVRLGARNLATILAISLLAALGISLFLTSRNSQERSATETAVTSLVTRLTNMALAIPEMSSSSGPERQINFKSGPVLPSQTMLWQVNALTFGRRSVRPDYWRMFTLPRYDGVSWTQADSRATRVPQTKITLERWPRQGMMQDMGRRNRARLDDFLRRFPVDGFDIDLQEPGVARQFSKSNVLVRQQLVSLVPNIGFLPVQPGVLAVQIVQSEQKEIRLRGDSAIDVGVVQIGQGLQVLSDVPPLDEYGIRGATAPATRLSTARIKASGVAISPRSRAVNLRLPATVPARVRRLSATLLSRLPPDASDATKAQRLALSIQQGAVYTLRPPVTPEGRDATDFFLFEGNRRGYCTHFAGALTVLCRAQGIPARVVSGFAGLEWDGPEAGVLREGNAHAWTEVWVDGFGWTVVDATPAEDRGDNAPTWMENWSDWALSNLTRASNGALKHQLLLSVLIFLPLAFWVFKRVRLHQFSGWRFHTARDDDFERRAVAVVYRRAARAMARKSRPKTAWETPDEWLQSCSRQLSPADYQELRRLTALYLAAQYNPQPLPPGSAQLATAIAAKIAWKKIKTAANNASAKPA